MSKPIDDFAEHIVHDILGHVSRVTWRRMFGGCSLYLDGHIFGLITSDTDLYFKVDDTNKHLYEEMGSQPFVYTGHKNRKPTAMPYWSISEEVMEDREKITELMHLSAEISRKKKK